MSIVLRSIHIWMDGCRYVFDIKFQRGLIINIVDGSVTKARIYYFKSL